MTYTKEQSPNFLRYASFRCNTCRKTTEGELYGKAELLKERKIEEQKFKFTYFSYCYEHGLVFSEMHLL